VGFYLRKSLRAGPFRVNLSKSGIGVSAGIPGLRVGTGPRGSYVHMGRGGVYYRSTSRTGRGVRPLGAAAGGTSPIDDVLSSSVVMEEVPSATVLELLESNPSELVADLNEAARRSRLSILAWLRGARSVAVFYEVHDEQARDYEALVEAFGQVSAVRGAWGIDAQGAVTKTHDYKINSGASSLVRRTALRFEREPPRVLKTNVVVPTLRCQKRSVLALPDQLLVREGKHYAAIAYSDLSVQCQRTRFIETERVPADSVQVDTTWQYVNVKGGPDRRYKNNRKLPIMEYAEVSLRANGFQQILQFSNLGAAQAFAQRLNAMRTAVMITPEPDHQHTAAADSPAVDDNAIGRPPAPAGWYADPAGVAALRWWDGTSWSDHTT
jgi:hypothetical protein